VSQALARDRAAARHYSLTDGQMHALHVAQGDFLDIDLEILPDDLLVPHPAVLVRPIAVFR
jgi:hypothetical protein